MLRSFLNSRLGKYYASVLNKYGSIAPIATALFAFLLVFSADYYGVITLLFYQSTVAFAITIALLSLSCLMALYYVFAKMGSKKLNSLDFVIFVIDLVLVLMILELILLEGSLARTIIFAVGIVIAVLLTIARMAISRPDPKVALKKFAHQATVKDYLSLIACKRNFMAVTVGGIAIFCAAFMIGGSVFNADKNWWILMVVTIALLIATVLFNIPARISAKRVGSIDYCIAAMWIGSLMYVIAIILDFSLIRLAFWIVALALFTGLWVILMRNTYVEEVPENVYYGDRGIKIYFSHLCRKSNLILSAILGIIAFVVMYALITLDVFFGVETIYASGFYLLVDFLVFAAFVALFFSGFNRNIGFNDTVGFALCVFSVLSLIPTIQFFSVLRLVCWILLTVATCLYIVLRIMSIREIDKTIHGDKVATNI